MRALHEVVEGSPEDFELRPTWTELLVATLQKRQVPDLAGHDEPGLEADQRTPRPTQAYGCMSLAETPQNKRLAAIRQLLAELPPDEAAFYSDEVDIHLNPKIGLD